MQTKHDIKAILGEDFFKEEVKCGYTIPAFMKKCWAVQIDLYFVFADICKRHDLKFFMFFGGLLGAVRHNGFIPWDDDLDVAMPRGDYEEFIKIAPQELVYPYFLRTPFTDPQCLYPIIDLVNSETTFIPKLFRRKNFNKGVPLDIFPIDYCDPNKVEEERKEILTYFLHCTNFMKRGCKGLNERQKKDLITYYTDDPYASYNKLHAIGANPAYKGSDFVYICNAIPNNHKASNLIWPSSCFEKSISHPFETFEVEIPIGYDIILKTLFGDYMAFPPVNERGAKNNQIFFDPDKPYSYYDAMSDEDLEVALGIQS